jgi:hypothetical protein
MPLMPLYEEMSLGVHRPITGQNFALLPLRRPTLEARLGYMLTYEYEQKMAAIMAMDFMSEPVFQNSLFRKQFVW